MNDSNKKLQEYEIVSNGSLSGGGELYTIAGDARTCYICGNQCEVMQSMMHAYTEIQVCGDCMFEHLYPFIETVKKIESEVKKVLGNEQKSIQNDTRRVRQAKSTI